LNAEPIKALREANEKSGREARAWEFSNSKDAYDFASKHWEFLPEVTKKYYDESGTLLSKVDHDTMDADKVRTVHVVSLDRQHTEFAKSEREAREIQADLKKRGVLVDEATIQPRQHFEKTDPVAKRTIDAAVARLKKDITYTIADAKGKEAQERVVRDAMVAEAVGHKVHSAGFKRRGVRGYNEDLLKSLDQFFHQNATARADSRFTPQIETLLKKIKTDAHALTRDEEGNVRPEDTERWEAINNLEQRVQSHQANTGTWAQVSKAITNISYLDRLGRASYAVVHQLHLPMVFLPHTGGRHGLVATAKEMGSNWKRLSGLYERAYQDAKGSFNADWAKKPFTATDYQKFMKDAFAGAQDAKRLHDMADKLYGTGDLSAQAGFELDRVQSFSSNPIMRGWKMADGVFRGAMDGLESLNRQVAAVTAYRLEFKKQLAAGLSEADAHTKGIEYARDTLNRTEGNYSFRNASPMLRNRALRPFLQFRQFGLLLYKLLGHHVANVYRADGTQAKMEAA